MVSWKTNNIFCQLHHLYKGLFHPQNLHVFLGDVSGGTYETNGDTKMTYLMMDPMGCTDWLALFGPIFYGFFCVYRIEAQLKVEQDALLVGGICLF